MGILLNPADSVPKQVSLQRWQRTWINSQHSINFSGLIQEIVVELIRTQDKKYFEAHKHFIEDKEIYRHEVIQNMLKKSDIH